MTLWMNGDFGGFISANTFAGFAIIANIGGGLSGGRRPKPVKIFVRQGFHQLVFCNFKGFLLCTFVLCTFDTIPAVLLFELFSHWSLRLPKLTTSPTWNPWSAMFVNNADDARRNTKCSGSQVPGSNFPALVKKRDSSIQGARNSNAAVLVWVGACVSPSIGGSVVLCLELPIGTRG